MGYYSIPIALLIGGIISIVETCRKRKHGPVDFLLGFHIIYFLSFCVSPIFLISFDIQSLPNWAWLGKYDFDSGVYFWASLLSLGCYFCVLFGYGFTQKLSLKRESRAMKPAAKLTFKLPDKQLFLIAAMTGAVGTFSFLVYTQSIGGFGSLFQNAILLRGGGNVFNSPFAFLKNVSPFLLIASYMFYALMKQGRSVSIRRVAALCFAAMFVLSMMLLFHKAGRMGLISYLITFPVAQMLYKGKIKIRTIVGFGAFFILMVLFGKQLFNYFLYPEGLTQRVSTVSENTTNVFAMVFAEFAFPIASLANVISVYPELAGFHWFSDIAYSWMYLMPDNLFPMKLPETISFINTQQFGASGTVPIDLVSFGFLSMGIAGVMVAGTAFGAVLALFDRLFSDMKEMISIVFRVAWINFFAFRVMYADPEMAFSASFTLMAGTLAILYGVHSYQKKTNKGRVKSDASRQNKAVQGHIRTAYRRGGNDALPDGNELKPGTV
ncbi:hypothetical protein [Paenibacillus sp. R14(2021)]|uniref:hypothetical protein n=1 Tax=Paenibacillus sp. R14(2021) TaxID=2859228 RepID=UPI001C6133D4|nr:hypothetical protein [Paenibacillus sp. R14(2021)]